MGESEGRMPSWAKRVSCDLKILFSIFLCALDFLVVDILIIVNLPGFETIFACYVQYFL